MLKDVIRHLFFLKEKGCTNFVITLTCRGYHFGKQSFNVVCSFDYEATKGLFNPDEDFRVMQFEYNYNGKTIQNAFNYSEWKGAVESMKSFFSFVGTVNIIEPENRFEEQEKIAKDHAEKIESAKEFAYAEGYFAGQKYYWPNYYEMIGRVDDLEQRIKNPIFLNKVRRMNPNGVLNGNEKGKELIKVISEIDVIKRHIRELTKSN
jgi:hypothetical protein